MSRSDPKRLRLVASSPLQRRVLDATAQEAPSPEERDRMARALGVSAAAIGVASGAALAKTTVLASKAAVGASASTTAALPWITVGVVGLALAGAIVGTRAWKKPVRPPTSPAPAAMASAPEPAASVEPAPAATVPLAVTDPAAQAPAPLRPELSATSPGRRARTATMPSDVREQSALVDAARNAVSSGAADRALALLRQYRDKYPGGIFRPEAAALKNRGAGAAGPGRRGSRLGQPVRGRVRRRTAHGAREACCWFGAALTESGRKPATTDGIPPRRRPRS